MPAPYRSGVFGSADGGRSWHPLGPPRIVSAQALAISPTDPAVVYAGSAYGQNTHGLYRSTDGGSSWQRLTDTLGIDVSTVALDPQNPMVVYVGAEDGRHALFRSTDGGSSWQPSDSGLPSMRVKSRTDNGSRWITVTAGVTALAIDPAHPETLYAATAWRGVFRSTDSGRSWHSFNAGLADPDVTALALDPTGETLYAGTAGGGVVSLRNP
jgi:photosystem II stability/assembly factor-like uncharacterized protein